MAARSGKDSAAPAPAGPSKDDNFVCALPTQEKSGASIGGASAAPSEKSEVSGATNAVPNRLTDTETKLKISGELPIWYNQKKSKYLKHMLHLFNTGIAMFVGKTHAYFLKIKSVSEGESPKHIEVRYISAMLLKIDAEQEGGVSFYSPDEGLCMLKTGNKGETHVLMDHFGQQKLQPQTCKCPEKISPCKCYTDPRKLLMADPSNFQQFTGTSGKC